MSIIAPPPMTPPDCDLRGYEFMPLFGQRLFGSHFYTMALHNPRAGLAAQKLWWEAWMQCPAGSLPDDEVTLARMADFGTDLKAWRKAASVALYGFVKCNDGRFYHPLLCEQAIDAFARRRKERERKAKMRASKALADNICSPNVPPPVPRDIELMSRGTSKGQAADVPVDRTGQDISKQASSAGASDEVVATVMPVHASPTGTKPPPIIPNDEPRKPSLVLSANGAKPHQWSPLADGWEVDAAMVRRPVVAGMYLDGVARDVARITGLDTTDWGLLATWLRDGLHSKQQILPAVRRVMDRTTDAPRSLRYFDRAVREQRPEVMG